MKISGQIAEQQQQKIIICVAQLMEGCSMNFCFRSSRKSVEVGAVVNKSI